MQVISGSPNDKRHSVHVPSLPERIHQLLFTLYLVEPCPLIVGLFLLLRKHLFLIHFDVFSLPLLLIKGVDECLI